jgi:tetratricopeptide (TPR) repeat protein
MNLILLRKIFSCVWVLYLAAFLTVYFFLDHKEAKGHAYGATLSRLQPPYHYLTRYADGKVQYDRQELLAYQLFFSQLVRVLADRPDGLAMLGFCQYELGDLHAAIQSFKKAADAIPPFMWFNYNLGYCYFQQKDYIHAVEYLNRAINSNPELIFKYMVSSKPYLDAIATVPGFQNNFLDRVRMGMRDSYKMLVLSYFHTQQYELMFSLSQAAANQKLDDDGFFHYYLGVAAFMAQKYEPAVLYLQQSIQINPEAAESYYYLALSLKALGKDPIATAAMQKASLVEQVKGNSYSELKNVRLRIF